MTGGAAESLECRTARRHQTTSHWYRDFGDVAQPGMGVQRLPPSIDFADTGVLDGNHARVDIAVLDCADGGDEGWIGNHFDRMSPDLFDRRLAVCPALALKSDARESGYGPRTVDAVQMRLGCSNSFRFQHRIQREGCGNAGWGMRDGGWGMRDGGWGMRDALEAKTKSPRRCGGRVVECDWISLQCASRPPNSVESVVIGRGKVEAGHAGTIGRVQVAVKKRLAVSGGRLAVRSATRPLPLPPTANR